VIEWIDPEELSNHPINIEIYGDAPDAQLVESMKAHGFLEDHPIGYVLDGDFRYIVSGHRRRGAARTAKLKQVAAVRLKNLECDPLAIREHIIKSNLQRVKTAEQMAREAAQLAAIETERAASRQKSKLKQNVEKPLENTVGGEPPRRSGRTREKVQEALGVGEDKARDLITAGTALVAAEKSGDQTKAAEIKQGLSKSVAAGARAAKTTAEPKPPKPKNGQPINQPFDDKNKIQKPLGQLVRGLDEKNQAQPDDRSFRACKYSLNQLQQHLDGWKPQ
jgi:hypothetical protein